MPDSTLRKYCATTAPLDALDEQGIKSIVERTGLRPGQVARMLLEYGLEHVDEAFDRWVKRGSERTRMRHATEARERGREFADSIFPRLQRTEEANGSE